MRLTKAEILQVTEFIDALDGEFPNEFDLDDMEQETLEVAIDEVVLRLLSSNLLKKLSKPKTFYHAFQVLFGEDSKQAKCAKDLQTSTSEYTDEFSPYAALSALSELKSALKEAANDAN